MCERLNGGTFLGKVIRARAFAGLLLNETMYPPGTRLPPHCHEHAYFCLIRQGTYREEYGGRRRSCGPLMLVFHPGEEVHAEYFDSEEVRSFNVELTSSWLHRFDVSLNEPFESNGGPLTGIALRLFDEFKRPDASSPLIIEGLALELMGVSSREARGGTTAPRWLLRVRDMLTEHCTAGCTLADLAQEAGVHAGHLASAFRRHFGCTVGGYARRKRVELACQYLTKSDTPLADVAFLTGFADQSHFTRTFKLQIGLTPAAYRKMAARRAIRSKN
jgi:AraC family transcriptional regulator